MIKPNLMMTLLTMSLAAVLVAGCASTGADHFPELQQGMDKDQVLQKIGNPYRTDKNAVSEKWGYRYFTGDDKNVEAYKYVQFVNGRVTSFGDDLDESRRLEKFKETEIKHEVKVRKEQHVDDVLDKEYSH